MSKKQTFSLVVKPPEVCELSVSMDRLLRFSLWEEHVGDELLAKHIAACSDCQAGQLAHLKFRDAIREVRASETPAHLKGWLRNAVAKRTPKIIDIPP